MNAPATLLNRQFAPGEIVRIGAPGYPRNGCRGTVNEHRHVGPPLDMVMVGVTFPDGWAEWFLPHQVGRVP